jgi:hypothetical protein
MAKNSESAMKLLYSSLCNLEEPLKKNSCWVWIIPWKQDSKWSRDTSTNWHRVQRPKQKN